MGTIQRTASLHESTVQKVALGEAGKGRRPRRAARKASPVASISLDRQVLAQVKRLRARPGHVQYVSRTEAIVWNHPAPWPDLQTYEVTNRKAEQ